MATRTDESVTVTRLREDIVATRNHMGRTVDAIEERLSPKNIKAQVTSVKQHVIDEIKDAKSTMKSEVSHELGAAKAKVREKTVGRVENMVHGARQTMTNAGSTTVDTVKTNPIPTALVAVGLGWLIASAIRGRRGTEDRRIVAGPPRIREERYLGYEDEGGPFETAFEEGYVYPRRHRSAEVREPRVGRAQSVKAKAESIAHDASAKAREARARAQVVARNAGAESRRVARRAGMQVRRAERGFERELGHNPLAFGAVALAIGAGIGMLLPHTDVEDRIVGERKDKLLDGAKGRMQGLAQQALSTMQEKAEEITTNLKSMEKERGKEQRNANGIP
jgi:hypothetical protein